MFELVKKLPGYGLHWLLLFAAILIAWWLMFVMNLPPDATGAGHDWHHVHHVSAADADPWHLFVMWTLMALAMMAPTFVPALQTYSDLMHTKAGSITGFYCLTLGYLTAWLVFAVGATILQIQLAKWSLINPAGESLSLWLNAGLLAVAGLYQFSSIKEACLTQCQAPLAFYMGHWRDGSLGAAHMGLRLGLVCVLCCWALMLLGFIGGVMSLLWMGAATIFMTLEKLPQVGRYLTRPTGAILLFAAAGAVILAIR